MSEVMTIAKEIDRVISERMNRPPNESVELRTKITSDKPYRFSALIRLYDIAAFDSASVFRERAATQRVRPHDDDSSRRIGASRRSPRPVASRWWTAK
jgi:hypothetical protein